MAGPSIATMILAASVLAVPVLAGMHPVGMVAGDVAQHPAGDAGSPATCRAAAPSDAARPSRTARPLMTPDGKIRIAMMMGATVTDELQRPIGCVRDILLGPTGRIQTIVLSIQPSETLLAIPFDQLKIERERIVIPQASLAGGKVLRGHGYNKA